MQPPLPPKVLAAQSKEMKLRLSTSSLVLGAVGPERRDWSLSSTQPWPVGLDSYDPAQRKINLAMKKGVLIYLCYYATYTCRSLKGDTVLFVQHRLLIDDQKLLFRVRPKTLLYGLTHPKYESLYISCIGISIERPVEHNFFGENFVNVQKN